MDLIIIILTTYFWGKRVELKGYSSYRWRIRHVSACIFIESLVMILSMSVQSDMTTAMISGFIALLGVLLFRYQKLKDLPQNDQQA